MKRLAITICICAIGFAFSYGQTPVWSLDHCVEYAMEHNCGILLQRNAEDVCRAELLQSKMNLLPTLNVYLNQYYNWGRSVDMQELVIVRNRLTLQTSGSIGASFTIFDGLAGVNTVLRNKYLASASQYDVQQAMLDVKTDITSAYLSNILARLSRQRLEKSLGHISQQAERLSLQVDCGARDRSELLEMEARIADVKAQIANAECDGAVAMQQLKSIMGCTDAFVTDTCITPELSGRDLMADCITDLTPPGAEALRSRIKAAGYGVKAARGAIMPSLSVSAAYGTYYSDASADPFRDQIDGNRNPSVSLNLVVPILNGGKAAAASTRAKAELRENELRLEQALEQASLYQSRLSEECISLREQVNSCRVRCGYCLQRLLEATARHDAGALSTSEWIDAQDAHTGAECDYVQCLCKYLFQLKLIEFYKDGCR